MVIHGSARYLFVLKCGILTGRIIRPRGQKPRGFNTCTMSSGFKPRVLIFGDIQSAPSLHFLRTRIRDGIFKTRFPFSKNSGSDDKKKWRTVIEKSLQLSVGLQQDYAIAKYIQLSVPIYVS
jgi:hypothetical protein